MYVNHQKQLTPRQKKVLDYIKEFSAKKGFSPSLEEISSYLKKSIGSVQHYIKQLKDKGYINKIGNVARGISLNPEIKEKIFLLGYIAAGEPIEPVENPEPIKVPVSMIKPPGDYYALEVKGNSMIEDGICSGDTVIIKHQSTAEPGETVVAITEKGATLKIFKRKNGKIFLEPRNKKLNNIYPKRLEIRGKFCGLLRK
jgi:repressor LexA